MESIFWPMCTDYKDNKDSLWPRNSQKGTRKSKVPCNICHLDMVY